jgi:hypoxanthine-DNA glycosylase
MSRVQSLPPVACEKSKALILGTMPGTLSIKTQQYYAQPKNAFWRIMDELFQAGPFLPYQERITRLQISGVALWDSLNACVRPGSLDSSITEAVIDDFPAFFSKYPRITHVFFNGREAEKAFRRHALPVLPQRRYVYTLLPSTSSTHTISLASKVRARSVVKDVLC